MLGHLGTLGSLIWYPSTLILSHGTQKISWHNFLQKSKEFSFYKFFMILNFFKKNHATPKFGNLITVDWPITVPLLGVPFFFVFIVKKV